MCSECDQRNCPSQNPSVPCQNRPKCKYCGLGHSTRDPNCPRYQKEKEVVAVSLENNIPFNHARVKVESGTVSYATMAKMGVTASSRDPSVARPGLAYNQAVGARVVCSLVDIGTGVEGDTDMAQEIDDFNSRIDGIMQNPSDLKIIMPTPIVAPEIHAEDDPDPIWDTLLTQVTDAASWSENLQEDQKDKLRELSNRFLSCMEILKNRFTSSATNSNNNA